MIKEWEFQKISVVLYPFPHIYDLDAIGEKKSGVAAFARVIYLEIPAKIFEVDLISISPSPFRKCSALEQQE